MSNLDKVNVKNKLKFKTWTILDDVNYFSSSIRYLDTINNLINNKIIKKSDLVKITNKFKDFVDSFVFNDIEIISSKNNKYIIKEISITKEIKNELQLNQIESIIFDELVSIRKKENLVKEIDENSKNILLLWEKFKELILNNNKNWSYNSIIKKISESLKELKDIL